MTQTQIRRQSRKAAPADLAPLAYRAGGTPDADDDLLDRIDAALADAAANA